jgi:hypothetical protein
MLRTSGAVLLATLISSPLVAQIDYRNLDDDRPVPVADAYPVERRALELMLPWSGEWGRSHTLHAITPEIAWGEFSNFQIAFKAPFGIPVGDGASAAGLRVGALYNFFTESPALPALALRGDAHLPFGRYGGEDPRFGLTLLATRSFGLWRTHVNAGWGFRDPKEPALFHPLPRWSLGWAIDRTLYRQSLLLVGSLSASRVTNDATTEAIAAVGLRWQWSPRTVLDAGVERRLSSAGPDLGLTIGLTRTLGLPWVERGAQRATGPKPIGSGYPESRSESTYFPGRFNWQFQSRYPAAARLFNAFDYGHAILYERLIDRPKADRVLEQRDYPFLVEDLLRRPPRLGVAEEAVAPRYAKVAWRAKMMFDWAHMLHRQIYDIYSDPRIEDSTRIQLTERITDDYLANTRLAFTSAPKSMALMDSAYYSQVFRKRYPRFNGLIWSYHWLQVGLYEPMVTAGDPRQKQAGVDSTVATFWRMLEDAPASMPATMPMTATVAPTFTSRHPRAAAIFDNLHMMHDIIADILASEDVQAAKKRQEIYSALQEFQDGSRSLMAPGHHH